MLPKFIVIQVMCCFVANGILSPESIIPFFSRRTTTNKNNGWELLLKSATFRTLSKYTGFSPSLDMKMEADTLLWEKLEGAKYIRKNLKHHSEVERTKNGLLIDMTRENGYLEFRQTDSAQYNFEMGNHKILALWKVQKLGQNHYIIIIKIPQDPPIEDKYEYTIKDGLRELKNKNKNKENYLKPTETKIQRSIELTIGDHPMKKQDKYDMSIQISNQNENSNSYGITKTPQPSYLYKPIEYYTLLGFQTPPPAIKFPAWRPPNDYYTVFKFPEFKQNTEYNGFLPSMGPTGSPPIYQSQLQPVSDKQYVSYYPTYPTTSQLVTTQKPIPVTYFKPSTEFIQYSEVDPFYVTDGSYTDGITITPELLEVGPTASIPEYQELPIQSPAASIIVDVPPLKPGESFYDIAINSIKNETFIQESTGEPTSTTLILNYLQNLTDLEEKQNITEIKLTTLQDENSSTERISKIRSKNNFKSPHLSSLTGTDNYDYAPLYIKWGEKIKPSETTKTLTSLISDKTILNKKNLNDSTHSNEETNDSSANESGSTTVTESQENKVTTSDETEETTTELETITNPFEINSTNYIISNITIKTPEEIVSDLTTMGLMNSTITGTKQRLELIKTDDLDLGELQKKDEDNQEEGSEPVSIIVNRISQSYSYKTSVGNFGNLKQLPEKT